MIPYDVDRNLHTAEHHPLMLDDGFSPPRSHGESAEAPIRDAANLEEALASKSDF